MSVSWVIATTESKLHSKAGRNVCLTDDSCKLLPDIPDVFWQRHLGIESDLWLTITQLFEHSSHWAGSSTIAWSGLAKLPIGGIGQIRA